MTTPTLHYDETSDTLYISFAPGEHATGIEAGGLTKVERGEFSTPARCAIT
jgi:uncharacterized protein YuzE